MHSRFLYQPINCYDNKWFKFQYKSRCFVFFVNHFSRYEDEHRYHCFCIVNTFRSMNGSTETSFFDIILELCSLFTLFCHLYHYLNYSHRLKRNVYNTKKSESYLSQHMRIQNSLNSCNSHSPPTAGLGVSQN